MILYVNGDSHSAGAELYRCADGKLVSFTEDDSQYWDTIGTIKGQYAHPECLKLSYGQHLATHLELDLVCDAVSGSSNDRILRTTGDYLKYGFEPDLIVIGWSTWEREEWEHDGKYWQVNASGIGHDWPDEIVTRYRDWIVNLDYHQMMLAQHEKIYAFHRQLETMGIPHLFFTCFQEFSGVNPCNWNHHYIEPYDPNFTYYNWARAQGFKTVRPDGYHFGSDAHQAWAEFLYHSYINQILLRK